MWTKLNEMMLKHGFPKPNFKEFMGDSAQVNWNVAKISSGVAFKVGVHELNNWLSFWHFHVGQWGRFMVHVNIFSMNFQ
jgi:hypothetical protein